MKNVHLLPTKKPSRLHRYCFSDFGLSKVNLNWRQGRHLYITSDEEIKIDDYITDGYILLRWRDTTSLLGRKKIVLTTDQDLIKDGVQAINDEFLEWFVKNPSCESVETKVEFIQTPDNLKDGFYYKIILPKEKSKQDLNTFKKEFSIKANEALELNSNIGNFGKPKQETLEEAAKGYSERHQDVSGTLGKYLVSAVFQDGAEWQAKQDFSKEQMIDFALFYYAHQGKVGEYWGKDLFEMWLKQPKKK
jgi:hypothetical protein